MATGYVTNWGNDANDGLTWETSKRTFQGAKDAGLNPVYAKGWFDEQIPRDSTIIGMPISIQNLDNFSSIGATFTNIHFKNIQSYFNDYTAIRAIYNSILTNIKLVGLINTNRQVTGEKTIFTNIEKFHYASLSPYNVVNNSNNTLHSINFVQILYSNFEYIRDIYSNILQLSVEKAILFKYSLFVNSKFQFTGGGLGTDETTYTYPTGATDDDKLQNLRYRMAAVYGGVATDYLIGCKYYSRNAPDGQEEVEPYASAYKDIFIDADNGNFYLKEDSIAAHMAYDGSYIGAKPVGQQIALSDFALTNIDANGKVTDQETDSLAQRLNFTDLLKVRKILSWTALGERAARNGQQINTESNLGLPISAGTGVLTALKTYMVINEVITLDNAAATSYNPWETFQAIDEGGGAGLGFSSSTNGQVQEVLIDKYDEKITVKSSKDNPALTGANTLTFYLHEQPKVNLDANGIAIAGNADAAFDPATAVDFYTRYITLDVQIKANNLPAR